MIDSSNNDCIAIMHRHYTLSFLALCFLTGFTANDARLKQSSASVVAPGMNTVLTAEEAKLVDLINIERNSKNLSDVPATVSLSQTAKWHLRDLILNAPDKGIDERGMPCGMQSWSGEGSKMGGWEILCYTRDHRYASGMWKKPREITGYAGNGFEVTYWRSSSITAEMAIDAWKRNKAQWSVITQEGVWKKMSWKAMGVAIDGNYASLWFGDQVDGKGVAAREQTWFSE